MAETSNVAITRLIELARGGDNSALGRLLEEYRHYISLMARLQLRGKMSSKVAPSDIVQDTFLAVQRGLNEFRGTTEEELLAWLRRIAASQLAIVVRRYHAQRRDVRREERLYEEMEKSSSGLRSLMKTNAAPSQLAVRREQEVVLANALARLPTGYADIVIFRHLEQLTFPEIASRTGKSINSVKNTWVRAIAKLRSIVVESS